MTLVLIFAGLELTFGIYAVASKSILRSAIGLALASAMLSTVFYALGAQLASVFELSVCSGLVTVIFISGVSLSHSPKLDLQGEYRDRERNRYLPALLIGGGAVMLALGFLLGGGGLEFAADSAQSAQEVLWGSRQAEVWGQIAAILCGGVAVTVLFREERRDR